MEEGYCVHCRTAREADRFLKEMDMAGAGWYRGRLPSGIRGWMYGKDTCYLVREGTIRPISIRTARRARLDIIPSEDFVDMKPPAMYYVAVVLRGSEATPHIVEGFRKYNDARAYADSGTGPDRYYVVLKQAMRP